MGKPVTKPSLASSSPVHAAHSLHPPHSPHSARSVDSPSSIQDVVTSISLQPVSYPRVPNQNNVDQQQRDVHVQSAIPSANPLSRNRIFTAENSSITTRADSDGGALGVQHDAYGQSRFVSG